MIFRSKLLDLSRTHDAQALRPSIPRLARHPAAWAAAMLLISLWVGGCAPSGQRKNWLIENDALRRDRQALIRLVQEKDAALAAFTKQVQDLATLGGDRQVSLFAPVQIEIASRSGGRNWNDQPGDDGVTVYVQPIDADGDAVKSPARIRMQIVDNTDLSSPKILALCEFPNPEALRKHWYARFATQHYSLDCPFPANVPLPVSRKVNVTIDYFDELSGATLTATKQLPIHFPSEQ